MFSFLMIVDDPQIAAFVARSGVDRLFVDLESNGKEQRQRGLDTVKSKQTFNTVETIRQAVPGGHLLVRLNPLFDGTRNEVDRAVAAGADSLMLPMFHNLETLSRFYDLVAGRTAVVPLFETIGAVQALPEIVQKLDVDSLHFGLNDLHLERRDPMMFCPLANGALDASAEALRDARIPFGIGGIARAGEGHVPPELLLGEHVRLGSTSAILSRSFYRRAGSLAVLEAGTDFGSEIKKLLAIYEGFIGESSQALAENQVRFQDAVRNACP